MSPFLVIFSKGRLRKIRQLHETNLENALRRAAIKFNQMSGEKIKMSERACENLFVLHQRPARQVFPANDSYDFMYHCAG